MTAKPISPVKAQLQRAYKLIKAGKKAEAFELLTPILAQQPQNIDAWWLAAFAADTPKKTAFACQKVLTLKPDHWAAQHLLAEQQRILALSSLQGESVVDPLQPIQIKEAKKARKRVRGWQILSLVTLPLVLIAAFLIFVNLTGNNLGLPIGKLFDSTIPIPYIPLSIDESTMSINTNTLVIGSTHDYIFEASGKVLILASVRFTNNGGKMPGRSFRLLDDKGLVLAYGPIGNGESGTINYLLPGAGKYRFRLLGTAGIAQGPYQFFVGFASTDEGLP
ncbi:MAG: hypothetical protein IAE83_21955 [Anaerolinea sp.]|nr:hypothetical protein [Anaerolinea sp.]MCC6972834.1 hypothetical protein [Anaerolineae bacterium]CAG0991239.1 hypothetical protein ANRL4_02486 [Anaerolineae bacterium]